VSITGVEQAMLQRGGEGSGFISSSRSVLIDVDSVNSSESVLINVWWFRYTA
jgi:hypothetical protein